MAISRPRGNLAGIMVDLFSAVILGIIQGLTEFIPISSTAHLRIASVFLDIPDPGAAYSAVIQLGTLASLLVYFREDLWKFAVAGLQGLASGEPFRDQNARMVWYLVLGTIPVSVFGLLLSDYIKGPFRSLYVIAGSLIALGVILWLVDWLSPKNRDIQTLGWKDALWIGLGQSMALIPGSSRSGTTLTVGLMLGFDRYAAMRFSFLLSIPAIALSGVYELIKDFHELESAGLTGLAVGTITAALVGYLTVAGLLRFLRTHTTLPFVLYRIGMGVLLLILLFAGLIEP
ncbi:MAG: undecaprenyl-diphosphatase UppP [bacterium]|nr:undecaprenyl-diphosphatase UppP [bacterium]